jgi:hypothetical protein
LTLGACAISSRARLIISPMRIAQLGERAVSTSMVRNAFSAAIGSTLANVPWPVASNPQLSG